MNRVTILILIDGFLQYNIDNSIYREICVTILILIDGFLQYAQITSEYAEEMSHNPYFNRWFSAMYVETDLKTLYNCHNPYFNRWFSAILHLRCQMPHIRLVTILILIDGFLQCKKLTVSERGTTVTILILIDGFLQLRIYRYIL